MKRLRGLLRLILLLPLLIPAQSFAVAEPLETVVIVELQTTGANNATSEEFVEIYNAGDQPIDVSDWKLQYSSASGTSWQNKALLNGVIQPKSTILLASTDYLTEVSDLSFTSGFKLEAGHVRLVSPDPADDSLLIIEDLVGWGTATFPETLPSVFAPAGNSLERNKDEQGEYVDTDNNKLDFSVSTSPTPESTNYISDDEQAVPEPEVVTETPQDEMSTGNSQETSEIVEEPNSGEIIEASPVSETTVIEETIESQASFVVEITELMPNPAPPLSDSTDEFIELYNPNSFPVDLTGYKLQSGNSFSYSYDLDDKIIGPNSYLTLYISETGLILSNTSGKARLLGPNGDVVSETDVYADAKDGESWVLVNGVWQWTVQPTPGGSNVFVVPVLAGAKPKTTKPKDPKKPATKKPASAKKKAEAKKATKKPKKEKEAQALGVTADDNDSEGSSSLHPLIIAAVGAVALGYAVYEYKDDVANKLRQSRINRELRRKTRRPA